MAMSTRGGKSRVMADINITPFTDVCLVLLIIFMVSASFLNNPRAKTVQLPPASRKASSDLPAHLMTITVEKDGSIYLDDNKVTYADLQQKLQEYSRGTPIGSVVIKGDQQVHYYQIVQVMDAVRATGCSDMSLAIEPPKPTPKPPAA